MDPDLKTDLQWCVDNEIHFKVSDKDGVLAVTAQRANVHARYAVPDLFDAESLGRAVWAAVYAVQTGTKHQRGLGLDTPA